MRKIPLIIVAGLIVLVLAISAVSFAATVKENQPAYNNAQSPALNQKTSCGGMCGGNCYNGSGIKRGFAGKRYTLWAEALGMSTDEFVSLRSQGKSIKEIAESRGLSIDSVISKVLEKERQYLETLVQNGKLTQQAAERILELRQQILAEKTKIKSGTNCFGGGNKGSFRGFGSCCAR